MNSTRPGLHTCGYGEDVLDHLARHIIQEHRERLPDLTGVTILLPHREANRRLRQCLLTHAQAQGVQALLGPDIDTLSGWTARQTAQPVTLLSGHQRELMLVEALINHPTLYGEGNPWMLADSLLTLFDELNEVHFQLPERLEDFLQQIAHAYGLQNIDNDSLVGEARLVHTLWQAWHTQMQAEGVSDRHTAQLVQLHAGLQTLNPQHRFYLAGFTHLNPAHAQWLCQLIQRGQAELFLQGEPISTTSDRYHSEDVNRQLLQRLDSEAITETTFDPPEDNYFQFIASAFSADIDKLSLQDRARQIAKVLPQSPLSGRLNLLEAGSAEQEAQAVDIQTRLWWLAGKRRIGIITENRRLARRVRALLERAGIELQDAAGWALSTTSAAAVLERWLETLEEDFAYQPLLDLLKSPFILPHQDRELHLATVYRFEQGIIQHENVARSLGRYRSHTRFRQNRLPPNLAADYEAIYPLLDTLERAARPLQTYLAHGAHAPAQILSGLFTSLDELGLTRSLTEDAAGQRVLEELQQMQAATAHTALRMTWREFRTWLGRTLERFNFRPPNTEGGVQLMSLAQVSLARFDAVIIAGAEPEYLPGHHGNSPFFNDGVRKALGLPTRDNQLAEGFYQFRQALAAAPQVLITRRREQDGEDIPASPWVERLQAFHQLAYGDDLLEHGLTRHLGQLSAQVTTQSMDLPQPVPANPAAHLDPALFPETLSASAYQQLVDCPYQFFAARCLKLSPPESVREMLEKSDYGERVHLCLQAFHGEVNGLPGPFAEPVAAGNKAAAIDLLNDIARQVFARDLEDNFLHRGWLKRWQESIPGYVEWQIERATQWWVMATEQRVEVPLADSPLRLQGRLDRIDESEAGLGILDYKTGHTDSAADILAGEAVQLPFYGLLAEQAFEAPVDSVAYVALDKYQTRTRSDMSYEDLRATQAANAQRLREIHTRVQHGVDMTAWGDERTCEYCQMSGVCRREVWLERENLTHERE